MDIALVVYAAVAILCAVICFVLGYIGGRRSI